MNIKFIDLSELELKTFTQQDAIDYCRLNNINLDKIIELNLNNNKLTDISGIKLFKNLKELELYNNQLTDISVIKNLNKLKMLDISENMLKDISVLKDLKNLIILSIINLKLESDQIQYIKSLKNLEYLWRRKGFKDMNILNQLNKNTVIELE